MKVFLWVRAERYFQKLVLIRNHRPDTSLTVRGFFILYMEKKSKVNNDNFILIQGFMLSDLKLKGNELLIYAIIHGFSHLQGQRFNGGLQYLSDWTSSTKQGVMNCLKSLESKGLIKKEEKIIQGVKFCEYHTTKLHTLCNKLYHPHTTEFTTPIQQSLPNSIDKSIEESILKNKEEISKEILQNDSEKENLKLEVERLKQALEEKNKKVSTQGAAAAKFDFKQALMNEGVEEEVANDFVLVRKQKKAPATQTAFKLILNECETNQFSINEAIKLCIAKNWLSFKYEWYLNLTKNDNSNNNANGYAAGGNKASNLSEKEGKSANRLVEIGKRPSISKLRQQNPFEVGQ